MCSCQFYVFFQIVIVIFIIIVCAVVVSSSVWDLLRCLRLRDGNCSRLLVLCNIFPIKNIPAFLENVRRRNFLISSVRIGHLQAHHQTSDWTDKQIIKLLSFRVHERRIPP